MKGVSIKPINVPNVGIGTRLIVKVEPFVAFSSTVTCSFEIQTDDGKIVRKGTRKVIASIVNGWTTDDMVIVQWIAKTEILEVIEVIDIPVPTIPEYKLDTIQQMRNAITNIKEEQVKELEHLKELNKQEVKE